jgi:hypothetical protein
MIEEIIFSNWTVRDTPVLNFSFRWLIFICYLYFEVCDFLFGSGSSWLGY